MITLHAAVWTEAFIQQSVTPHQRAAKRLLSFEFPQKNYIKFTRVPNQKTHTKNFQYEYVYRYTPSWYPWKGFLKKIVSFILNFNYSNIVFIMKNPKEPGMVLNKQTNKQTDKQTSIFLAISLLLNKSVILWTGETNEEIGNLIQNYIREIEELR